MKPDTGLNPSNPSMERSAAAAPVSGAPDEAALLARARAGDESAFRVLVERHQHRAYHLALRMLRSHADAEDVAQEAFVRAWLALPRFRGDASFTTWLHAIVVRRALDRAEVLKRRRGREADIEYADTVASVGHGHDERRAQARRLEHLMEQLSGPQRAAVSLFYYEGNTVEQLSEMLNMPTGTVKTHLSRARAALRTAWMQDDREHA